MACNCCGDEPTEKVKRWSKNKHECIEVPSSLLTKKQIYACVAYIFAISKCQRYMI